MPVWFELRDKTTGDFVPFSTELNVDDYETVEVYAKEFPDGGVFSRAGFYRMKEYTRYGEDIPDAYMTKWKLKKNDE